MGFTVLSVCVGLAFIAAGTAGFNDKVSAGASITQIPRARLAGEVLGIVCLAWSAYHGCLMLEGGLSVYRKYVWGLVPITAILAYGHLEYLFSRSLGGLLVLCASAMVHGAFARHIAIRPVYSLFCYLAGLWGLSLIGLPWRFRDLLVLMQRSTQWRRRVSVVWLVAGAAFVVMPFLRRPLP